MNIAQFIQTNNIREVDAILLRKKFFGMLDHYVIFMGWSGYKPVFIANYKNGIQVVSEVEMNQYLQKLQPEQIEHFQGSEQERVHAWNRAWSRLGEKAYDLIHNNCEHFKNWVHHSEHRSKQVKTAGTVTQFTGGGILIYALASRNPWLAVGGVLALIVGEELKRAAKD